MANVYATVTVDWEGLSLNNDDITEMEVFNVTFPAIPLTHFICPAYFTRVDPASQRERATIIKSVIKPVDEIALHIHCWYSLISWCGVAHVTTPTYNTNNDPGPGAPYIPARTYEDYGHGVPFGWYTVDQIRRILVTARQLLVLAGFIPYVRECVSFRCGGWLTCTKLLLALRMAGFLNDASAVPARYIRMEIQPLSDDALYLWLPLLWGDRAIALPTYLSNTLTLPRYPNNVTGLYPDPATTPIAQPVMIGDFLEIPDTGVLSDYITAATLQAYIDNAVNLAHTSGRNVFISLGWHQEGCSTEGAAFPRTVSNLQLIADVIRANQARLTFIKINQVEDFWQAPQVSSVQATIMPAVAVSLPTTPDAEPMPGRRDWIHG